MDRGFGWLQVVHVQAKLRLLRGFSVLALDEFEHVVASIAADDEGHLNVLSGELHGSREALVIMRVTREDSMRIEALGFAYSVDLAKHVGAAGVIATGSRGFRRRLVAEWRVMHSEQ